MNTWYVSKTGNGQGLVIEECTGRNVAVTYDEKDANLIALAPRMLEALNKALEELDYLRREASIRTCAGGDFIEVDDTVLREIWSIKSELAE